MRVWITALAVLGTVPGYAQARDTDMIVDCTQVVQDYAYYLDHPGEDMKATANAFADLFTSDAVLKLANTKLVLETFVGHKAIAGRYLQGRDVLRAIHSMSNVRIVQTGARTARGTNYVTVFMHPIGSSMGEKGIRGIAEYRDEYEMTDEGCRISKRVAVSRLVGMDGAIADPMP